VTIASALAALAAFAGILGTAGLGRELLRERSGAEVGTRMDRTADVRPSVHRILRRLGHLIASASPVRGIPTPGDLEARLVAAGEPAGLGMREWTALKVVVALLGGVLGALVAAEAPARIAVLTMLSGPVGGFVAPDLWLARLARRRLDSAVRELPDMLDLLRVTIEAGMPPARAIGVVGSEFRGTLAGEWKRVAAEIELGIARDEAFAGLYARLPADELGSLVESLMRTSRYGVPLGRTLELQARSARESRRLQVRERAARAGPKIQLVVALLLVPAVLLVVAAGLLVELGRSGLFLPA
jgi:tight adherence protein C